LVAVYVVAKGVGLCVRGLRSGEKRGRTASGITRRQFLIRGTYAYAGAGFALSAYGLWEGGRLPEVTRRTLYFADLPVGLEGLRILHLADVHAGIHMRLEKMRAIVAQANALAPDLVLQTGDMIDISTSFIPDYVRAFRDLHAPLGVLTSLGNHDHYTGAPEVITGVRDAGQVLVRAGSHLLERN